MKAHNLANRFRRNRMKKFQELVAKDCPVKILDLGGTIEYWQALPGPYGQPNVEITILNLNADDRTEQNLHISPGNACAVGYPDMSFDIVHSNSVIEHVGDWSDMEAMAGEVRRLAPAYFIQTPNFWFPVEPHHKLPLVQFLPLGLRQRVTDGLGRGSGSSIKLLNPRQMRRLFPDADLWCERIAGLTKSLVAIRKRFDE